MNVDNLKKISKEILSNLDPELEKILKDWKLKKKGEPDLGGWQAIISNDEGFAINFSTDLQDEGWKLVSRKSEGDNTSAILQKGNKKLNVNQLGRKIWIRLKDK
jgi:hypothetical protein